MTDPIGTTQTDAENADGADSSTRRQVNVCHVVGSIGVGGRESLLEEIIRKSPEDVSYVVCGLRVREGQATRFEQFGTETISFEATSKLDIGALLRLARFLYGRQFDIIHAHGLNAQIPCRVLAPFCGAKAVVSTMHGIRDVYPERLLRLERLTRRLETLTVAVSYGVEDSFVGSNGSNRWTTIQNGIDVESFNAAVMDTDPSPLRRRFPISSEDFVFLNVGRYVPPKSQLDLIEAMKRVLEERSDVHLFIVGGRGAMENKLRHCVSEYGLTEQVTVTGRVDEIHPFYAISDAFVSSSIGEGLPIVQLEAMAAGLPVIATDIPGVRELVVDGETGVLVPPKAPDRLGSAMLDLAESGKCGRYGQAGYERVCKKFHIENTVFEYVSLYRDLVEPEVGT